MIIFFCLLACDSITDTEYENQLNICGVLRAVAGSGTPLQHVKVEQTYKMNEQSEHWISDATVILSNHMHQYLLDYDPQYERYARYLILHPWDTVSITVTRQGLDTLYGSTIIPGPISVMHPMQNETVNFSDSIILDICDNGTMYYGYGENISNASSRLEAYYLPDANDSTIIIPLQGFGDYLGAGTYHFLFVVY